MPISSLVIIYQLFELHCGPVDLKKPFKLVYIQICVKNKKLAILYQKKVVFETTIETIETTTMCIIY